MPLTDTAIRKAKPGPKARKLYDAKGLYLVLRPDGSRWWRLKYRRPVTGKENTLSLGVYPDTGLADARDKRDAARKLLASGHCPSAARTNDGYADAARHLITAIRQDQWKRPASGTSLQCSVETSAFVPRPSTAM